MRSQFITAISKNQQINRTSDIAKYSRSLVVATNRIAKPWMAGTSRLPGNRPKLPGSSRAGPMPSFPFHVSGQKISLGCLEVSLG